MLRNLIVALTVGALSVGPAVACTDVRIVAKDGSVMTVRTMEYELQLHSELVIVPRGRDVTSPAPRGAKGLTWKTKYGFVYVNALRLPVATDGMNEAGLGIGALYLPGDAHYQDVSAADDGKVLSNLAFGNWILANFATVKEVRAALDGVVVWGQTIPVIDSVLPLHYAVHDASGASLVIEYVKDGLHVYDNPAGVLTNSPTFDWQLTNLRNYANLTADNVAPVKIGEVTYAATGQGAGLHGLPGDVTPPSRFVNAAATLHLADRPKDAAGALTLAQHLIDRVDIPRGLVRNYVKAGPIGIPLKEFTQWTVFRDHTNRVYLFRTYDDTSLRALDLKTVDFSSGQPVRRMKMIGTEQAIETLSSDRFTADAK
jgi:choloylglycine hydrolase